MGNAEHSPITLPDLMGDVFDNETVVALELTSIHRLASSRQRNRHCIDGD
jgi:hypothetical protein